MLNFLGLMGGGMPHATEQEIVSKGLDTKQADLFTLDDMLERFDFSRISLGGPVFDLVEAAVDERRISAQAFAG